MKNTEMRLFFALIIFFASLGDLSLAKKLSNHKKEGGKQINAVHDTAGPNASIQTAIRRTPTVTSYNNAAPLPRKPSTDMSFSNSNTNDASSANDYPKTAGIVSKNLNNHRPINHIQGNQRDVSREGNSCACRLHDSKKDSHVAQQGDREDREAQSHL